MKKVRTIGALLVLACACETKTGKGEPSTSTVPTPTIGYAVRNFFPHDVLSYTEGLLVHEGRLFESSGSPTELPATRSIFGVVDPKTGKIDVKAELPRTKYFGEGIAVLNGKIYQLTYKEKTGFIYDLKSFRQLGQFSFQNEEGWGLTTDGTYLIMSDGSYNLTYFDPENLRPTKILRVTENGLAVEKLNELEFINGYLYANVFLTTVIVKIEPGSGNVVGKIELGSLAADAKTSYPKALEMNGIAYDSSKDKIYVTGKMWPKIYEIEFPH